ncbi:MAG: cyclic nucleotide-binding domain-containing protein [Woeseiaceae bacterium]|nr:cyclic nucleotide-binding domain-containing protein [Woeseiaceae bacterium]
MLDLAIVGGGPAGLSAAARARQRGLRYCLLEASAAHANTIQRYQKGKHVMAEPGVVPLRSDIRFAAGTREAVLQAWQEDLAAQGVEVRHGAEVTGIAIADGAFRLALKNGESLEAKAVVLAIGLQGNPRRLGVPGDDAPFVQYTLDDPEACRDETIVVVGAGDAAIENALALARQNRVFIVNRRDEFARAKEGNLTLISRAIEDGLVSCFYNTTVAAVEADGGDGPAIVLDTDTAQSRVPCDRIIARLGAIPPRRFVESCGIVFPNDEPTSLPELSTRYETNVPGLYVIGALAGYPLIKQAMNQGYEVVEYVTGNDVQPADHDLLASQFSALPFGLDVDATLELLRERLPLFARINALVQRELVLASDLLTPQPGDVIFRKNDYTNSFISIVEGAVDIETDSGTFIRLGAGQFFGEMSLLSGRRRAATVRAAEPCVLLESPRREIVRLMNTYEPVRREIDRHFIMRTLRAGLTPNAPAEELQAVAASTELRHFKAGETLFREGDEADGLHLIRAGSVSVSRRIGGRDIVTSYVAAGNFVGEMGLITEATRSATVAATVATESIFLRADVFRDLLERHEGLRERMQDTVSRRLSENLRMEAAPEAGDLISFLMQQGLGEATDVLLIDENLWHRLRQIAETACAETHDGTSRLDRAAGPSYAQVHVPTSCRHCEDPHCMKDCPPDAIRRAPNGEVYIEDSCIGCGNCEQNCPYDVIQMAAPRQPATGLVGWLLTGRGSAPGRRAPRTDDAVKKAVKCDMCKDLAGGPACVRACPTGAAIRMSPADFVDLTRRTG